ncbi:DDE-domain-containing protein [Schizophyllum commune Tattone D]|nr:DDE-domain-containing protein [Schizophyllum commune Tattone D]
MDLWVHRAMQNGVQLTGEVLRQKWTAFADIAKVPQDERVGLSNGWLSRFKNRHALKELRRFGEAGSADPQTGLFYAMPPDRGLAQSRLPGVKGKKVRLTYAFTMNADGSEKLPPFIIGKAKKPRAFGNKTGPQLGFVYRNNAKAWMTTTLYQEWLHDWDARLRQQDRHIILFVDNFSGHQAPSDLTNIKCEFFKPNLTPHVQPADAGIIRCFKAHYRSRFIQRAIDRYDNGTTPSSIYDLNQLEGMRLADAAWNDVSADTIRNCWRKTGILPDSLLPPSSTSATSTSSVQANSQAEAAVTEALDALEETGVLQAVNRATVEELIDSPLEKHRLEDGDEEDRDIADAVLESRERIEMGPINGGDDDVDDDAVEPPPTRQQALAAVDTLNKYVGTLQEPFARRLEVLLASLGRSTRREAVRNMRDTKISDFFART